MRNGVPPKYIEQKRDKNILGTTCRQRAVRCGSVLAGLLGAGLFYALGAVCWGWQLPCLFHQITGMKCPGCGISRMCLAILDGDFSQAFYWNGAVFLCLPILAVLLICLCIRYIRLGDLRMSIWQQALCWIMAAALVLFAIFRNFSGSTAFY